MKHVSMLSLALCMALGASAQAADQTQTKQQDQTRVQTQEQVYGSELMTQQERNEYQNRMRSAKTQQERAKAQGKTLPDMPPAGMGPGSRMGPGGGGGMGPGGRGY